MTWALCGRLLAGHAAVTLGYFTFLTRDIMFFLILLVMLSTCAGILFTILAAFWMTRALCGGLLAGHAAVTLGYFTFLTRDILFFLIMLSTCARILFTILAAYAVGLLTVETGALTGGFFTGVAEVFQYATDFAAFT